jgi:hypothetical protein
MIISMSKQPSPSAMCDDLQKFKNSKNKAMARRRLKAAWDIDDDNELSEVALGLHWWARRQEP